jgi:hypothetical protein
MLTYPSLLYLDYPSLARPILAYPNLSKPILTYPNLS